MFKPNWYLPDTNWFAQLPDAPRLSSEAQAVVGQLAQLLDESYFCPAKTVATTHVILLAVEHLGDTMTYAAGSHDLAELARLLCGLNLIQAHLTQAVQRISVHLVAHENVLVPRQAPRLDQPLAVLSGIFEIIGENEFTPAQASSSARLAESARLVTHAHLATADVRAVRR